MHTPLGQNGIPAPHDGPMTRPSMLLTAFLGALLLAACTNESAAPDETTAMNGNNKAAPSLLEPPPPGEDSQSDEEGQSDDNHEIVEFEARFDIDRTSGGKGFQGSWLEREGQPSLVCSYRPMEEYFAFVDKRVVARGYHYSNPINVQQIGADHFNLISLKLADGETPREPPPSELPVPPWVDNRAAFEARKGRWVQIFALLEEGKKKKDKDLYHVTLKIADGTSIRAIIYTHNFTPSWAPRLGTLVSVLGTAHIREDGTLAISPPRYSICDGKVSGCGMNRVRRGPPGRKGGLKRLPVKQSPKAKP